MTYVGFSPNLTFNFKNIIHSFKYQIPGCGFPLFQRVQRMVIVGERLREKLLFVTAMVFNL